MKQVTVFTFNPFEENTILVQSSEKECIIFDPGCYYSHEETQLKQHIEDNGLRPVMLINTHGHLDHVFGNAFIYKTYGLKPKIHRDELPVLQAAPIISSSYGVPFPEASPEPEMFLNDGENIIVGDVNLEVLLTPGHSPASLSFYCPGYGFLIGGDVLFKGSIGRTDLPGGNYQTLIHIIKHKFFTLPDDTVVYPGHGPHTTIGYEKRTNPFFQD